MKKLILFTFVSLGFTLSLFSQTSEIDLPDLTTVVTGENENFDVSNIPDFSEVIVLPGDTGDILPKLPEVELIEGNSVVVTDTGNIGKQIYAEGKIGGGYPASFIGEFSAAKIFGDNPFSISFNHNSSAGYAGTALSEGYNNNQTEISVDKHFAFNKITLDLLGNYENSGDGLQRKVESITAIKKDTIDGAVNFNWKLPYGFLLGSQLTSAFYNRYSEFAFNDSDSFNCPDWIKETTTFAITPSVFGRWEGNGFAAGLSAVYSFVDFKNRGDFGGTFEWKNDLIKVYSSVNFVIGNNLNENSFVVPFTVGVESSIPVYFADRKLGLALEGGMLSNQNSIRELEKEYKFSGLEKAPSETSDWYGSFKLQLPLKNAFSANLNIGFKSTAFGNGVWNPQYDDSSFTYGIYNYSMIERNALSSNLAFTYRYKLFAITAGWVGNWLDVTALQNKHTFTIDMSLQSKEGKWGTALSTGYSIDAEDKIPEINFEAYTQISSSVKLILSAEDIIKLVTASTRTYAGKYISNSGNVTALVKFLL